MFDRKSNKNAPREERNRGRERQEPAIPESVSPEAHQQSQPTRGRQAMIGAKVKVNGDIVSSEDLLVEGEVTGTITLTDNELVVGSSGRVEANVNAKTIRIEGEVTGDIEGAERVVICASGNVQGNVTAPRVMLEDGGRFKGSIDMGSSKSQSVKAAPLSRQESKHESRQESKLEMSKPEIASIDKAG
ncbi:MAG: polymer-forming cytoskeletal protein [Pseudomonadota bacterium]